jgi:RNA polymerase sigma-70 factor (ECF subfamily)
MPFNESRAEKLTHTCPGRRSGPPGGSGVEIVSKENEDRWTEDQFVDRFQSLRPQLITVAARYIPERLRRLIEPDDVVQDAFISARRGLVDFDYRSAGAFHKWLQTIVVNQAREAVRNQLRAKRDRRRLRTESDFQSTPSSVADFIDAIKPDRETPSAVFRRKELWEMVLRSWDRLSEIQKEAVLLRHFQKRSLDEAAEIMGMTPASVRGHCQRGLALLRKSLEKFL